VAEAEREWLRTARLTRQRESKEEDAKKSVGACVARTGWVYFVGVRV
jgi:hypothetical protein